jgi:uncharacterized protein YqgC (DUF456 family)
MRLTLMKVGPLVGVLVVLSAAGLLLRPSSGSISLQVCGYTTNRFDAATAAKLGTAEAVAAIVALTNTTERAITFLLREPYGVTDYSLLHRTGVVWVDTAIPHQE